MSDKQADVVIVGGGLGGLTLSIALAKKGVHTILLEKEQYPFHRVCGEYISMESYDFLNRCDAHLEELELPMIRRLRVSAPNGRVLEQALPLGGFGISRFTLDQRLVVAARNAGVEVMEACKVNHTERVDGKQVLNTSKGSFSGRIVAGAFGKRSNLDNDLDRAYLRNPSTRLSDFIAVKYHVQGDLPSDVIELHNFKDGYCGISKVEGSDRYCLCYLTTAQNLKDAGGNIRQMEETVLMKNPFLNRYFREFPSLYEKPLTISQVNFSRKSLREQGILLLGDAAGLIPPLCGNGMSMAMHAAHLLSELIPEALTGKTDQETLLRLYAQQWKSHFGRRLTAGRLIQLLFGKPIATNVVLALLNQSPKLTSAVIGLTHGERF